MTGPVPTPPKTPLSVKPVAKAARPPKVKYDPPKHMMVRPFADLGVLLGR